MDLKDIVSVLEGRGWEAEIVSKADVPDLVPVNAEGLMKCVDGRLSDQDGMRGPKTLGGIYAIASMRGVDQAEDLAAIVDEVKAAGYVPSVHGDDHKHTLGCGYFKLWSQGDLTGLEPPSFDGETGKAAVLDAGGVYETLEGGHEESVVMINFVEGMTLEPKAEQRFVVDAWVASKFDLDLAGYLTLAAETVEKLCGPKKAKLIQG